MLCEGGGFSVEKPPPSRSLPKRLRWGDSGGRGGFSERSPSPPRPLSPEEQLAFGGRAFFLVGSACELGTVLCKLVVVTAADRAAATVRCGSLSSVSLTADSSLCGGSLLAALPIKPPLKGEVLAVGGRRGSFPQRRQVTNAPPLRRNHLCRSHQVKRQPLFGREREGGASLREAASLASLRLWLKYNRG